MATERTLWVSNHSRSACNCEVTVPNTAGGPPAIETYICSLPTSTNAAWESRTGKSLIPHLHIASMKLRCLATSLVAF